jgi:polyisoprenoid-binding protein YceI
MNTTRFVAVLALSVSSLVACGGAADSSSPATSPVGSTTGPSAKGSYAITPTNSKIEWTGSKTSGHHDGSFASFSGAIEIPGAIEQGSVSVDIDTNSLTIAADPALGPLVDKLTGHLKSPDFFDVAQYPKATFKSASIAPGAAGTYNITGALTLHGGTKTITFPATITADGKGITAIATFPINRKDFGLNYPGKPDDLIKDEVQIKLTIHADKK